MSVAAQNVLLLTVTSQTCRVAHWRSVRVCWVNHPSNARSQSLPVHGGEFCQLLAGCLVLLGVFTRGLELAAGSPEEQLGEEGCGMDLGKEV